MTATDGERWLADQWPTPPRPEPVATDDLVAQARRDALFSYGDPVRDTLHALANALEDTKAERDRAHATLREIRLAAESKGKQGGWLAARVARLARERLENP